MGEALRRSGQPSVHAGLGPLSLATFLCPRQGVTAGKQHLPQRFQQDAPCLKFSEVRGMIFWSLWRCFKLKVESFLGKLVFKKRHVYTTVQVSHRFYLEH